MKHRNHGLRGNALVVNVAIVFLLILLAFLIYQLFRPSKSAQDLGAKQVVQEAVFLPPVTMPEPIEEPISMTTPEWKPVAPSAPSVVAAGVFVVQAASFRQKARAEALVQQLKEKGQAPTLETKDLGDKGIWYRVLVGSFDTQAQAQRLLDVIKKEHAGAFIRKM